MPKVKVIKRFNDVKVNPNKIRKVEDAFETSKERADDLVRKGMVEIMKEPKNQVSKEE